MQEEPMVMIPIRVMEIVAHLLKFAGEESAAGLHQLEDYQRAEDTPEARAYLNLNEVDSALAAVEGYFAQALGGGEMWNLYERRGLERWEAMAG